MANIPVYTDKEELIWNVEDCGDEAIHWSRIICIHNSAKSALLLAENASVGQETFFQPIQEHRNALEHIIRYMSSKAGIAHKDDAQYQVDNLRKALGHEYRAFFDAADFLSIKLLSQIGDFLAPYETTVIAEVDPDYFRSIYPALCDLRTDIACVREQKDITKGETYKDIDDYNAILKALLSHWRRVSRLIPDLEKAQKEANKKTKLSRNANRIAIIGIIMGALVALFLAFYGGRAWEQKNHHGDVSAPAAIRNDKDRR